MKKWKAGEDCTELLITMIQAWAKERPDILDELKATLPDPDEAQILCEPKGWRIFEPTGKCSIRIEIPTEKITIEYPRPPDWMDAEQDGRAMGAFYAHHAYRMLWAAASRIEHNPGVAHLLVTHANVLNEAEKVPEFGARHVSFMGHCFLKAVGEAMDALGYAMFGQSDDPMNAAREDLKKRGLEVAARMGVGSGDEPVVTAERFEEVMAAIPKRIMARELINFAADDDGFAKKLERYGVADLDKLIEAAYSDTPESRAKAAAEGVCPQCGESHACVVCGIQLDEGNHDECNEFMEKMRDKQSLVGDLLRHKDRDDEPDSATPLGTGLGKAN